ncbi:MAG: DNA photolyase family protein [Chloroflexi bacterium]|nr:DNA photolyase family protein [Chloroflexota bacterium]
MTRIAIAWFRRDLRIHDNPALTAAVASADVVIPVFVFDDALLNGRWPAPNRIWFMRESVVALSASLAERGAGLRVLHGRPAEVVPAFAREVGASDLFLTRDATPYGLRRDRSVVAALEGTGTTVHALRGLYVHEPDEIATRDGRPYTVYGPFRRAWDLRPRRIVLGVPDRIPGPHGAAPRPDPVPDVAPPTADRALIPAPGEAAARDRLARWLDGGPVDPPVDTPVDAPVDAYAAVRNRLDMDGSSRLSQDLRFGLLSPVEVVDRAAGAGDGRGTFTREIAWREFYAHVLWHHPRVVTEPFRSAFARLPFREDPAAFAAWAEGRTGYPVVDAAMRQLRAAGFVHNRARMIAASFLSKHLFLDYRLGETEFMGHLVDGDLASNNGGWQWTASTGTDPQPYFRVFNPTLQAERFDPRGAYVRRWVPELRGVPDTYIHEPWRMGEAAQEAAGCRIGVDYPPPIVDHADARARVLAAYGATKAQSGEGR